MSAIAALRLALVVGIVILGLKLVAYWVTGSVALLSDGLESIVNIVAALVALFTVQMAARPPDVDHPFGHSKFEYLAAVLEGVLIVLAAVTITRSAWIRLQAPLAISGLAVGGAVSLLASGLNAGLARYLVAVGRRVRSPALVADGLHLWTDVMTSVGVVLGVGLAWLTGWWVLDPLLAMLVAINVLRVGWKLIRDSVGGLVDEGLPQQDVQQIQQAIRTSMAGAQEVHDLKTRLAGRHTFVDFHLVVPSEMSVAEAHAICDRLEAAVERTVPGSLVTIHVEPEYKAKHEGYVVRAGTSRKR
ncbi:MAG: cation transporter [Trueperaceae bacterium]|nr:MAG: cation transporter [Trueperaceae bacterium]